MVSSSKQDYRSPPILGEDITASISLLPTLIISRASISGPTSVEADFRQASNITTRGCFTRQIQFDTAAKHTNHLEGACVHITPVLLKTPAEKANVICPCIK